MDREVKDVNEKNNTGVGFQVFGHMSKRGIAGSYGRFTFCFLRILNTDFQSDWSNFLPTTQNQTEKLLSSMNRGSLLLCNAPMEKREWISPQCGKGGTLVILPPLQRCFYSLLSVVSITSLMSWKLKQAQSIT